MSKKAPNQIRAMRKDRGWSQADLARRCGLTQGAIHRLESTRSPYEEKLRILARVFEVPPAALLDGGVPAAPADRSPGNGRQVRYDTALLRRVVIFVETCGHELQLKLGAIERAQLVCSIYEMALQDLTDFDLDVESLDLKRYLPAVEIAAGRRAA